MRLCNFLNEGSLISPNPLPLSPTTPAQKKKSKSIEIKNDLINKYLVTTTQDELLQKVKMFYKKRL